MKPLLARTCRDLGGLWAYLIAVVPVHIRCIDFAARSGSQVEVHMGQPQCLAFGLGDGHACIELQDGCALFEELALVLVELGYGLCYISIGGAAWVPG